MGFTTGRNYYLVFLDFCRCVQDLLTRNCAWLSGIDTSLSGSVTMKLLPNVYMIWLVLSVEIKAIKVSHKWETRQKAQQN